MHEFVYAFNTIHKGFISWPQGAKTLVVMEEFKKWCGLFVVQGAINGIHLFILKPLGVFVEDYYYHKIGGYNIMAKCVVDYSKKNIDVFVRLPSSVNDSNVLCRFGLYRKVQCNRLLEIGEAFKWICTFWVTKDTH
jgi:hypothetical protein